MTDKKTDDKNASQLTAIPGATGAGLKPDPEGRTKKRDPEDRPAEDLEQAREKGFDKTLADTFPTSDPPSSIPDPALPDTADDDKAA